MNTPYITVIAVGVLILTRRRASREQLKQEIKACWGTDVPRRFFLIEEDKARKLSDRESAAFGASCRIDDITASDLDLYSVTERIGHPMSAAGAEVLFAWLRHPLLENEPLKKREALIARMTADEEGRREAQMILAEIGSVKGDSFYGQMEKLDSGASFPDSGMGLLHDLGGHDGTAAVAGRRRRGARAGKAEAHGR